MPYTRARVASDPKQEPLILRRSLSIRDRINTDRHKRHRDMTSRLAVTFALANPQIWVVLASNLAVASRVSRHKTRTIGTTWEVAGVVSEEMRLIGLASWPTCSDLDWISVLSFYTRLACCEYISSSSHLLPIGSYPLTVCLFVSLSLTFALDCIFNPKTFFVLSLVRYNVWGKSQCRHLEGTWSTNWNVGDGVDNVRENQFWHKVWGRSER